MNKSTVSPTGPGTSGARKSCRALLVALVFLSLFHSTPARASGETNLSLEIRGPTNVIKLGDEIPIELKIHNHGAVDYAYANLLPDRDGRIPEYKLTATTPSGQAVADPRGTNGASAGGPLHREVLLAGDTLTKTILLNLWALIQAPGEYEITGVYSPDPQRGSIPPIKSPPIRLTVLPRARQEMRDYLQDLSRRIDTAVALRVAQDWRPTNFAVAPLIMKAMFTCDSEAVPLLLRTTYSDGTASLTNGAVTVRNNAGPMIREAFALYIPHSEETRQAMLQSANKRGLNWTLVAMLLSPPSGGYEFKADELMPLARRALAETNRDAWAFGIELARRACWEDAFTPRLCAIAMATNTPVLTRCAAVEALARHRSDEGVATLKKLLHDSDPTVSLNTERAIRSAYSASDIQRGLPLRPDDFDARFQRQPKAPGS